MGCSGGSSPPRKGLGQTSATLHPTLFKPLYRSVLPFQSQPYLGLTERYMLSLRSILATRRLLTFCSRRALQKSSLLPPHHKGHAYITHSAQDSVRPMNLQQTYKNFDLVTTFKTPFADINVSKWRSRVSGLSVVHLEYDGEYSWTGCHKYSILNGFVFSSSCQRVFRGCHRESVLSYPHYNCAKEVLTCRVKYSMTRVARIPLNSKPR